MVRLSFGYKKTVWSVFFSRVSPMDRRSFLRWSVAVGALAVGGLAIGVGSLADLEWIWDDAPGARYKVLSDAEGAIVRGLAGGLFPGDDELPSGDFCDLDLFMDDYLAAIPRQTAGLLRVLLRSIDRIAMLDFGGPLHTRPRFDRVEIVKAWDTSSIGLRRAIFQSIKLILGMGYCEHPDVVAAVRFDYSCGGMT